MKTPSLRKLKNSKPSPRRHGRKPLRQKDIVAATFDAFAAPGHGVTRIMDCKDELTMHSLVAILFF